MPSWAAEKASRPERVTSAPLVRAALTRTGRVEHSVWKVTGHEGPVLDVRWNPFNDNIVASASEDCRVRTWQVPDGGLTSDLRLCLVEMTGHR